MTLQSNLPINRKPCKVFYRYGATMSTENHVRYSIDITLQSNPPVDRKPSRYSIGMALQSNLSVDELPEWLGRLIIAVELHKNTLRDL